MSLNKNDSTGTTTSTSQPNPLGIRRIDHVAWTVPDLNAVIDFYQRVIGAQLLYQLGPIDARDIPSDADGRDWTEAHVAVKDGRLSLALLSTAFCGASRKLFS